VTSLEAALEALLGKGSIAPAANEGGGPSPIPRVRPKSAEALAEVLALANSRRLAVLVRGGGTKSGWGRAPARCDLVVETTALNRLVEHEPGDLTCVAEAGLTLGELQRLVGSAPGHNQRLMLDPPQGGGATLGGMVATAASGPLRARYGTPRDLLLGARFALADGTLARTGGKVVKNVAGYDLGKLLTGSQGTLAVIVEVALRLHPVPPATRWVVAERLDPQTAQAALVALRRAPVVLSMAELLWPEGTLVTRLDGAVSACGVQAEIVRALLPEGRVAGELEAEEIARMIEMRPWGGGGPVLGVSVPLTRIGELVALADVGGPVVELSLRGTVGSGEARLREGADVAQFTARVAALGGWVAWHRSAAHTAPPLLPADPVAARLALGVKRALDPNLTLAPGRGPE
jgi:glycolate oxidase FAD binding subunit